MPEIETEKITAITQTTAISGGKIISDGRGEISAKGVCWSLNANPNILDSHSLDGSGNADFISLVVGLSVETEYHLKAYATNIEGTAYGDEIILRTLSFVSTSQIIADHTIVDKFDDIPQYYIDQVKKLWLVVASESHGEGYIHGLSRLESSYPAYDVSCQYLGDPEAYTTAHLRASNATWGNLTNSTGWIYSYGEEDWYLTASAIAQTKTGITYCHNNNLEIGAIGFAWCWDKDYNDMTDYISATKEYIKYCADNNYATKVFFTTGPVDEFDAMSDEGSYLKSVGYATIRDSVKNEFSRILFDYADILCYDEGSETPNTQTWNGHIFPIITEKNLNPVEYGHISVVGQIRLAKAMWWMLARIAGWDGEN